jgi:hypothetical protein
MDDMSILEFDVLIVGGGIAGLQSALDLADQGFQIGVVENDASIGGKMIRLSKVFPTLDCASCITTPKMAAAAHHDNITLFTYYLCPHVSQAVMIANRNLQRDYRRLEKDGFKVEKRLFHLQEMMVKYDSIHEEYGGVMDLHDYINLAGKGTDVTVTVKLEYVPAVEHFANVKNAQTFLMADLKSSALEISVTWNVAWPVILPIKKRRKRIKKFELPMNV